MGKKDKRLDTYIAKSAEFAKPILKHIRELVHKACPEVEETLKWGFPHFVYGDGTLVSMAAFKEHMAFGFWKASLLKDPNKILEKGDRGAMGHFGRITSLKNFPPDRIMIAYIKEAAKLNEAGIKVARKKVPAERKVLTTPKFLIEALGKNKSAKKHFDEFSYSKKKEYIEWLNDAKTEDTKDKRLKTAIEWISQGKGRNWKYESK